MRQSTRLWCQLVFAVVAWGLTARFVQVGGHELGNMPWPIIIGLMPGVAALISIKDKFIIGPVGFFVAGIAALLIQVPISIIESLARGLPQNTQFAELPITIAFNQLTFAIVFAFFISWYGIPAENASAVGELLKKIGANPLLNLASFLVGVIAFLFAIVTWAGGK